MALSAAERKRRQLEREREAQRLADDSTYRHLRTPFFEHLNENPNLSSIELSFELMGLEFPEFEDDTGPEAHASETAMGPPDEDGNTCFAGSRNSIGRAETMVDNLLDAASEMASIINRFKKDELNARLAEIEASNLADPAARKQAMQDIAHIHAVLSDLDRNTRVSVPKWRVKGV